MMSSVAQHDRLDRTITWGGLGLIVGLPLLVVIHVIGTTYGILSAFTACMLGATCGCYRSWRTERGVWILAALILFFASVMWAMFVGHEIYDAARGARATPWPILVDGTLCTMIFGWIARLSYSVLVHNFRYSRVQR